MKNKKFYETKAFRWILAGLLAFILISSDAVDKMIHIYANEEGQVEEVDNSAAEEAAREAEEAAVSYTHLDVYKRQGEGRIEGIGPEFHADALTESLYAAIAGDYARAAAGLNLPLGALRFTGGCAEKNPALRRAICGALGLGGEDDAFDVMEGMRLLARMAERLV